MHLHNVDMNLFVVFHAIYREAHITRAAQVLGLTQPAVSHSLSRLREFYQDPLFIRRGSRMEPTPLARTLLPGIREALGLLQSSLPTSPLAFDPKATRQNFLIAVRDPLEAFFVPQLMRIFTREAPEAQLTSLRIRRQDLEQELRSGQLDLAFDVLWPVAQEVRSQKIMEDAWVVVGRRGHPLLQSPLTADGYFRARHVAVSSRRAGLPLEDFAFKRLGWERRIAMRCQHLFVAARTVSCTDLLLTLPAHFVSSSAGLPEELDQAPLPLDVPLPAVYMYWHDRLDQDPASIWLRTQVASIPIERGSLSLPSTLGHNVKEGPPLDPP